MDNSKTTLQVQNNINNNNNNNNNNKSDTENEEEDTTAINENEIHYYRTAVPDSKFDAGFYYAYFRTSFDSNIKHLDFESNSSQRTTL
jgi:hypothetical protein